MKYTLAILTALGIALLVTTVTTYIPVPDRGPLFTAAPPPPEAEVIASRDITNVAFDGKGTVSYEYLADHVPARISPDEVPELRTARSYTKLKGVKETKDGSEYTLESIFYAQKTFEDVNGSWRYIEYGTTTEDVWKKRPVSFMQKFKELMIPSAYAAVQTIYSGSGDGYTYRSGSGLDPTESVCVTEAWSGIYAGANSAAAFGSAANVGGFVNSSFDSDVFFQYVCSADMYRTFLPFDTSAIPATATITGATLNVFLYGGNDDDNDGTDYITVLQTTQTTHTTLDTDDHPQFGVTEAIDSGSRADITSISRVAYTSFTLNATGRGFIKKSGQSSACSATTGITCLGLMEGHDFVNAEMISPATNIQSLYTSEQTGTANDPYLSVTYSLPVSFGVESGGRLDINSNGRFEYSP